MNYIERHEWLHLLLVHNVQFEVGLMSDGPDWEELLNEHFYLCGIEEALHIKENR